MNLDATDLYRLYANIKSKATTEQDISLDENLINLDPEEEIILSSTSTSNYTPQNEDAFIPIPPTETVQIVPEGYPDPVSTFIRIGYQHTQEPNGNGPNAQSLLENELSYNSAIEQQSSSLKNPIAGPSFFSTTIMSPKIFPEIDLDTSTNESKTPTSVSYNCDISYPPNADQAQNMYSFEANDNIDDPSSCDYSTDDTIPYVEDIQETNRNNIDYEPITRQNAVDSNKKLPFCQSIVNQQSYHTSTSRDDIFPKKIVVITKRKKKESQKYSLMSSCDYRRAVIESRPKKKKKDDDWSCIYCCSTFSGDVKDKINKKWVECDKCMRQMHIECVPKIQKESINFNGDDDGSDEEVQFSCEFCLSKSNN